MGEEKFFSPKLSFKIISVHELSIPSSKEKTIPTEYRKDRKKWGYRFFLHGKSWKRYAWDTELEARNAEAAARTELLNNPPLTTDSLGNVAALYLIDSAEQGRSKWRIEALRYNLNALSCRSSNLRPP